MSDASSPRVERTPADVPDALAGVLDILRDEEVENLRDANRFAAVIAYLEIVEAERRSARSQVEALRADAARLDVLQRFVNDANAGSIGDVTIYGTWGGCNIVIGAESQDRGGRGVNLRAAIDHATSREDARALVSERREGGDRANG